MRRLCYIDRSMLYFVPNHLEEWGDDWNDKPYEHNAGPPYGRTGTVFTLMYSADMKLPHYGRLNSSHSVQEINQGKVPWLVDFLTGEELYAGASPEEVVSFIERNDGEVYYRSKPEDETSRSLFDRTRLFADRLREADPTLPTVHVICHENGHTEARCGNSVRLASLFSMDYPLDLIHSVMIDDLSSKIYSAAKKARESEFLSYGEED